MSVLRVEAGNGGPRHFTLLRNTAHADVAHLAREKSELLPDENTLTVVPGFIGAYPNAIYRSSVSELPALREALAGLASEADYRCSPTALPCGARIRSSGPPAMRCTRPMPNGRRWSRGCSTATACRTVSGHTRGVRSNVAQLASLGD